MSDKPKWYINNELDPELLTVNGMNPYVGHISSARLQMFSSHIGQKLNILHPTERYQQTGIERQVGQYNFNIKFPCDAKIIKVIHRYERTNDIHSIEHNPQDIIIFENVKTNEIDYLDVPRFGSYHQYFGFDYVPTEHATKVHAKAFIEEGTVIADAPSASSNGGYMYGRETKVAFWHHPSITNDGIVARRGALELFSYKTYEPRVVETGQRGILLNLYGTPDKPKFFPDIGEKIRDDGMLVCTRNMDKRLGVCEQSVYDMMTPDHIFDKPVYVDGREGKVIDIRMSWSEDHGYNILEGCDEQLDKYVKATKDFNQKIFDEYLRLKRERKDALHVSERFQIFLQKVQGVIAAPMSPKLNRLYRMQPLDDYRIEFIIEYTNIPNLGSKLTDTTGGKGVICAILEDDEMPKDKHGNIADLLLDGNSTINRMNFGRLYEHYFNSVSQQIIVNMVNATGIKPNDKFASHKVGEIFHNNRPLFDTLFTDLLHYYSVVAPLMVGWFNTATDEEKIEHVASCITAYIYLYLPTNNPVSYSDTVDYLEEHFAPLRDKVVFNYNGELSESVEDVVISSMYIMNLEKNGKDWSAVSSAKTQVMGLIAQVTRSDKSSSPTRNNAVRGIGEAESRITCSNLNPEINAEFMDRNNSPQSHKALLRTLMNADHPTNIPRAINRTEVPFGGSKPIQMIKHTAYCAGWEFNYTPVKTYCGPEDEPVVVNQTNETL